MKLFFGCGSKMRVYTRTGDDGTTRLADGSRVRKNDECVESYAAVDELNAVIGWAAAAIEVPELLDRIRRIQEDLFVIGAGLATPAGNQTDQGIPQLAADSIGRLENWIDQAWNELPALKHFVLPGGDEAASRMHLARVACRRAERLVVAFAAQKPLPRFVIPYLNRLSDLFFAWARWLNHRVGVDELLWNPS